MMTNYQIKYWAGDKSKKKYRMPLHKNYDKLINSKNADMQNINMLVELVQLLQLNFYKIYFKQNSLGSFRYSWDGIFKYGGALNSGGHRLWCKIIK